MANDNQPVDLPEEIMNEPAYIQQMRSDYSGLRSDISQQIEAIRSAPEAVDTQRLVSDLETGFGELRNRLTAGALLSTEQAGIEMDVYFGSPTGDQRSAVRMRTAASIKNNMLKTAFDSIAGLYMAQMDKITSVELTGAQMNLEDRTARATQITNLIGTATSAYLGTYGEINKSYSDRLNAAVQYAGIEAQNRRHEASIDIEQQRIDLATREFESKGGMWIGTTWYPRSQLQAQPGTKPEWGYSNQTVRSRLFGSLL